DALRGSHAAGDHVRAPRGSGSRSARGVRGGPRGVCGGRRTGDGQEAVGTVRQRPRHARRRPRGAPGGVNGVGGLRPPRGRLAHISTHWPSVTDPAKFALRYAPAIRGYLLALLPAPADVDEVLQEFLLGVVNR